MPSWRNPVELDHMAAHFSIPPMETLAAPASAWTVGGSKKVPSQNETVIVPECHIYESELFEDSFFDDHRRNQPAIREVASNTVQVARADFVFGWIGDGSTNLTAYDLDDGC